MIIFFHADWCSNCKFMEIILNQYIAKTNRNIKMIDVEKYPEEAEKYQVYTLPTLIDINTEDRVCGVASLETLINTFGG